MGKRKIQDKSKNYLDYIPKTIDNIDWINKENGLVQIIMYRDSLYERAVRKLFFTPENYKIDLDKIGSFIWNHIDGESSLYDISQLVYLEFGETIELLYGRLLQYINILKNNKLIKF